MRGALALGLLGTTLASAAPNTSRRLQAGSCADLDGDGTVNVNGAHPPPEAFVHSAVHQASVRGDVACP